MKKVKTFHIIFTVVLSFLAFSCKKDPTVKIETLSKFGEEFYFGEKVIVWAGTDGDRNDLSYDWSCNGGQFLGQNTQHLFENLWKAPSTLGIYTITVVAKDDDVTDSRSTDMHVNRYFFDKFQNSLNNAEWSSANTTLTWNIAANPTRVEVPATSSLSSKEPYLRRTLSSIPLVPPFSVRTDLGYLKYKTVSGSSNVTISNMPFYISLYFVQPATNLDKPYVREIRWEMLPPATGTNANWRIRMESFVPTTSVSNFAANGGNNLPIPEPFANNAISGQNSLFTFGTSISRKFTLTVDKDVSGKIIFSAYVDATVWINKSYAIQNFLDANGLTADILQVKEFRVTGPRLSSSSAASGETTLYLNSVYINDANTVKTDGTVGFEDLGTVTTY